MYTWYEYTGNIHIHTVHSDGTGTFTDVVRAARAAGLDFVVTTDHNVLVQDQEGYQDGVLVLVGEEVHDVDRQPEVNHCLCVGVQEELSSLAADPQVVIDAVRAEGGASFLAHPIERSSPLVPETYPWVDWRVDGFTGIELWNYMSGFREFATNRFMALFMSFAPHAVQEGPLPEMLALWDDLLATGPVVAIGGSDAHAQTYTLGPIRRCMFPYEFLFRAVNTHILTPEPFTGDADHDRSMVIDALRRGHAWVAYDLVRSTRHFRFWATGGRRRAIHGDTLAVEEPVTFHAILPASARLSLQRDGEVVYETKGRTLTHKVDQPGVYRLEAWKSRWGKERGWIFANPIYLVRQ